MVRCGIRVTGRAASFRIDKPHRDGRPCMGVTTGNRRLAKNSPVRRAAAGSDGREATREGFRFQQALVAEAPGVVLEHLSEGLLIVDVSSQLIYWNPAALRLYGFGSTAEAVRSLPDLP